MDFKKIVGFAGSVGVALLLAAIGLLYDARTLLYAAAIILTAVIAAWLFLWGHRLPQPVAAKADPNAVRAAEEARERQQRRCMIIDDARRMVAEFELQSRWDWRQVVRYNPAFAAVRPHLSEEYKKRLKAVRTAIVPVQGLHDPLAAMFLEELDRLEREWKLS